jgi:hypothetical protein
MVLESTFYNRFNNLRFKPYPIFSARFVLDLPYSTTVTIRGTLSPPPTSRAMGSASQGHARDRYLKVALGNTQDKRQLRHTYPGRSVRVAARPESQAAPPHIFYLAFELIVTPQT